MSSWRVVLLTVALAVTPTNGQASRAVKLRRNKTLDDVIFTDSVSFDVSAHSTLDCARQCVSSDSCTTFTYHMTSCRGHSEVMTSAKPTTVGVGARSYLLHGACPVCSVCPRSAVRCPVCSVCPRSAVRCPVCSVCPRSAVRCPVCSVCPRGAVRWTARCHVSLSDGPLTVTFLCLLSVLKQPSDGPYAVMFFCQMDRSLSCFFVHTLSTYSRQMDRSLSCFFVLSLSSKNTTHYHVSLFCLCRGEPSDRPVTIMFLSSLSVHIQQSDRPVTIMFLSSLSTYSSQIDQSLSYFFLLSPHTAVRSTTHYHVSLSSLHCRRAVRWTARCTVFCLFVCLFLVCFLFVFVLFCFVLFCCFGVFCLFVLGFFFLFVFSLSSNDRQVDQSQSCVFVLSLSS